MTEAGQMRDPLGPPAGEWRLAIVPVVGVAIILVVLVGLARFGVERTVMPALLYLGFGFVIVTCFGRWLRADPAAFVSIAVPAIVVAAAGLLAFPSITPLTIALAWTAVWVSPLRNRLWPWWSRNVLRRFRPGSGDRGLLDAMRRIAAIMRGPKTDESWAALWDERGQLGLWASPVRMPVIAALQSLTMVQVDGAEADADRVAARLDEETRRWYSQQQNPFARRDVARRRQQRPTWGSNLEYEYPALEAMLALGTTAEQHRMRGGAARIALDATGLSTPEHELLVGRAEAGLSTPEDLAVIETWLEELNATEPADGEQQLTYRRFRALYSLQSAVAPLEWPLDAADAIYEAIRSLPNPREPGVIERMLTGVLGADRAAMAAPIQVEQLDPSPASPRPPVDPWAYLARRRPTRGFISRFGVASFAVGAAAYLVAYGVSEIDLGIPADNTFFVALVLAVAAGLLAVTAVLRRGLGNNDEVLPVAVALLLPATVGLTDRVWSLLLGAIAPAGPDSLEFASWLAVGSAFHGVWTAVLALGVLVVSQALYRIAGPRAVESGSDGAATTAAS